MTTPMREVCADFLEREMREDFTKNQVPELSQEGGVGVEGSRGPSGRGQAWAEASRRKPAHHQGWPEYRQGERKGIEAVQSRPDPVNWEKY